MKAHERNGPKFLASAIILDPEDVWMDRIIDDINIHVPDGAPGVPEIVSDLNFCVGTPPAPIYWRTI